MRLIKTQKRLLDEIIIANDEAIPFERIEEPFRMRFDWKATSEELSENLGRKAPERANAYHLSYIKNEKPFREYSFMDLLLGNISQEDEANVQLYHLTESEREKL